MSTTNATESMVGLEEAQDEIRRLRETLALIYDRLGHCYCCRRSKMPGRHQENDGTWPTCSKCDGTGLPPAWLHGKD